MNIYDYVAPKRNGEEVSLKEYEGRVLLIVNTATGCGFTPQYKGLEEMYQKYHEKGLEILDFPCNQFGNQAKESDEEIHEFCTLKYHTSFDQFKKIDVNGKDELPLYTYLKNEKPYQKVKGLKNSLTMKAIEKMSSTAINDGDIRWNFTKFLVDRNGKVVDRFEPVVTIEEMEERIQSLL